MLIANFYSVSGFRSSAKEVNATIVLNAKHKVYDGHFADNPVVPGVIQLQIAKEVLEQAHNRSLFMGSITQVKYLVPIVPDANIELSISISYQFIDENKIKTNIIVSSGDVIFTKAKIVFTM